MVALGCGGYGIYNSYYISSDLNPHSRGEPSALPGIKKYLEVASALIHSA